MTIDLVAFGQLVFRKRKALHWTGETLAFEALGNLDLKGKVSEVENGKGNPTDDTIRKYCRALGITVDDLPGLSAILHDPASGQQTIDQLISEKGSLEVLLRNAQDLHRGALIALADRFGIDRPSGREDHELRALLTDLADEYTKLKAQIDGMDDRIPAVHNMKRAAQGAIVQGRFDEVEEILARADEVETDINAKTKETRAQNALVRKRPMEAFAHFSAAADMFQGIDPDQVVERRLRYEDQLYQHGLRHGGPALTLSERMIRDALARTDKDRNPAFWAAAQNSLAIALVNQGSRQAGAAGVGLLAKAIDAFRAAQQFYTEADHPLDWAMTMQNLGGALLSQGRSQDGAAGAALIAQAIDAFRAALRVRTETDHPLDWAMTMQNLGVALQNLGSRQTEAAGVGLFIQAVDIFRASLRVYTEADHPLEWAATMQNLAIALRNQGSRLAGAAGVGLLAQAVDAYSAALRVYTEAEQPVNWSGTMQNLGAALRNQGSRLVGAAGLDLLCQAADAYRAALRVSTKADHPVDWAMTQENLAILEESWSKHPACNDPLSHLTAGLVHVEAALTVYGPEHMPYDHGTASELRDRLLAAIAAHS